MIKVAILDAGSQYWWLIDKKVRWNNVESDIYPIESSIKEIWYDVEAIIVSGWPESVNEKWAPKIDQSILDSGLPILWICYGFQLLNHLSGWTVEKWGLREDWKVKINIVKEDSLLFDWLNKEQEVLMAHGDSITEDTVGDNLDVSAISENWLVAAIENIKKKYYWVQFHPETDLTENWNKMISNFLDIAKIERDYTMENREKQAIDYIKETVWDKKVLCLVSWWVDSTVLAVLLAKALPPEQIVAVHVDNGFMRFEESEKVERELKEVWIDLKIIKGVDIFLNATTIIKGQEVWPLNKVINPEHKRKIIWDTFMKVSDEEIKKICDENWWNIEDFVIAQWTLRTDLIESGSKEVSKKAATIKTHHNDTEKVREKRENWEIIEPLKTYYKDEVRKLGSESLGIDEKFVWRQPFPWPGSAIRIICAEEPFIDESFEPTNKLLDNIVNYSEQNKEQVQKLFPNNKVPKDIEEKLIEISSKDIKATLLPIKTVWAQWDWRTYSYAVSLSWEIYWDDAFFLSNIIPKLFHNVNRVVNIFWDEIESNITEITPTHLWEEICERQRLADKVVTDIFEKYNLMKSIAQVPVVLVPLPFWEKWNHSIVIRPFMTNDFMTWTPAVPWKDIPYRAINEIIDGIENIPWISKVMYDLTSKPPGTTEWE